MSDEKEVVIKISAKNLTAGEFAKARKDIAGLGDEAETQTKKTQGFMGALSAFGKEHAETFKSIAKGLALGTAGVVAMGVAIEALGKRGADVADVKAQFDVLNRSIGNDSKLALATLDKAMDGTVNKFDLMKSVNIALSQGLKLTNNDYKTTGEAARVLADRVGGDTKEAFDTLTMAMASGRDMTLKTIGLNIDAAQATKAYADSIGKEVADLNEAETKEAKRLAILKEMKRVVEESGRAEMDFGDRIAAAHAKFSNFVDDLGEGIAASPVLAAGMDAIGKALSEAFGGDQENLIKTIVHAIEQAAIFLADLGRTGVSVADGMGRVFFGLQAVFNGLATGIVGNLAFIARGVASIVEIAASLPGATNGMKTMAVEARNAANTMGAMRDSFAKSTAEAWEGVKGNGAYFETLNKIDGGLVKVEQAMSNAMATEDTATAKTKTHKQAVAEMGEAYHMSAAQIKESMDAIEAHQQRVMDAQKALNSATSYLPNINKVVLKHGSPVNGKYQMDVNRTFGGLVFGDDGSLTPQLQGSRKIGNGMATSGPQKIHGFAPEIQGMFARSMDGAPEALMAAITGGGSKFQAVGGAIGKNLFGEDGFVGKPMLGGITKLFGAGGLGKAIGGMVPMIGPMIGPAIQGVTKLIGKMFGTAGRDAVRDFASGMGGFDEIHKKLGELGAAGEGLWKGLTQGVGKNNPEQAKAAIEAVNKALAEHAQAVADATEAYKSVADQLSATTEMTPALEAALQSAYDAQTPAAYTAALKDVQSVMNEQASKTKEIDDALQRYGLTWEELGPKARAAKLGEMAMGLKNDFDLLAGAGVNINHVLEGMKPKLNEFVASAKKTGTEVPEALKPMLQSAIDAGVLIDENGKKYEKLEDIGLTFGKTMEETMASVSTAIEHLAQVLEQRLGGAINGIPKDITISGHYVPPVIPNGGVVPPDWNPDADGNQPQDPGTPTIEGSASGGLFSSPALRVIAETKPEIVGSPNAIVDALVQAMNQVGGGFGGGKGQTVEFNLNTLTASPDAIRQLVYREIGPMFLEFLRGNKNGGALTEMKSILGV